MLDKIARALNAGTEDDNRDPEKQDETGFDFRLDDGIVYYDGEGSRLKTGPLGYLIPTLLIGRKLLK
jgi:hypothetical protein